MVEGYLQRGDAYSYIGEYAKAIADFSEAIKLEPDYTKAYCLKKREYDKAVADYERLISLTPYSKYSIID